MISSLLVLFLTASAITACIISGKESGFCASSPLPSSSFCASQIAPYVCVPAHNTTWANYDAIYKDRVVEQIFMGLFQQQLIDEYQNGNSSLRLTNNPACYNAYWKFICQWNFPPCMSNNQSKTICATLCNDFYSNCGSNIEACSILFDSKDLGFDETC